MTLVLITELTPDNTYGFSPDPGVPANWSWTSGAIPALKGGLA